MRRIAHPWLSHHKAYPDERFGLSVLNAGTGDELSERTCRPSSPFSSDSLYACITGSEWEKWKDRL